MNIFSKLFKKKNSEEDTQETIGGIQDFMVYYQAVMASNMGITNLGFLPDMAVFKRTLKVPTQNNKLGVAEKSRCKKMLMQIYGMEDTFFKEIDASIKKNCRNVNDVKNYLFMFQGFSNDLIMLISNLMQWKFRIPNFFKKMIYTMTEKTVNDILTKNTWKDDAVRKTCINIRKYQAQLGYSQKWMTEYAYKIVTLAKKEKLPKEDV